MCRDADLAHGEGVKVKVPGIKCIQVRIGTDAPGAVSIVRE